MQYLSQVPFLALIPLATEVEKRTPKTGLLLRKFSKISLVYAQNMVILIRFLNSNPEYTTAVFKGPVFDFHNATWGWDNCLKGRRTPGIRTDHEPFCHYTPIFRTVGSYPAKGTSSRQGLIGLHICRGPRLKTGNSVNPWR